MRKNTVRRTAFTLMELMVVVAIIALLAAILMPALANALEMGRSASCLSNMHNIGTNLMLYCNDNRDLYPTSYCYVDGNASTGGYYHWTAAINPTDYTDLNTAGKYPKVEEQYVCPSHPPHGFAPSNFTTTRIPSPPPGQVAQTNTLDDKQCPRISYTANEIIMPRKKYSAAHDTATPPGTSNLCLVDHNEIESIQHTILLGEFSNSSNCIWGSSVGGGSAYKSHRPTNGVKDDQSGGVFDGENYTTGAVVHKLTFDEATTAINAVLADKSVAATTHHISYINPNAHKSGSNYTFADGHAGKYTLSETLDQNNYMWGRKVYSCVDKPIIQDN